MRPGGTRVVATTPDGDTRFVAPALAGAPPATYAFDDWNPVDLPGKPGFGGSAAACVAACVAAGRPAADALAIHHQVQGSGSGIDVLASIHGGMGRVAGRRWTPLAPHGPTVVYSGQSARTGPRLQRYLALSDRQRFLDESATLTAAFVDDPIRVTAAAGALLAAMARAAGIAYTTPGLARIAALARDHGGAAKPSGAGGGDCAVAYLPDPAADAAFQAACAAAGLPPIAVAVAPGAAASPVSGQPPVQR